MVNMMIHHDIRTDTAESMSSDTEVYFSQTLIWKKYLDRGDDVNNISRLENKLKRIQRGKL